MKFEDFVRSHPTCSVIADNACAREIYETIVWNEQNRIKMIELSDAGIPSVCAVAAQIKDHCEGRSDLDLTNHTVKQVIGRMIAAAVEPLGYRSNKKKRISEAGGAGVFFNGTVFAPDGEAAFIIEKRIVSVKK